MEKEKDRERKRKRKRPRRITATRCRLSHSTLVRNGGLTAGIWRGISDMVDIRQAMTLALTCRRFAHLLGPVGVAKAERADNAAKKRPLWAINSENGEVMHFTDVSHFRRVTIGVDAEAHGDAAALQISSIIPQRKFCARWNAARSSLREGLPPLDFAARSDGIRSTVLNRLVGPRDDPVDVWTVRRQPHLSEWIVLDSDLVAEACPPEVSATHDTLNWSEVVAADDTLAVEDWPEAAAADDTWAVEDWPEAAAADDTLAMEDWPEAAAADDTLAMEDWLKSTPLLRELLLRRGYSVSPPLRKMYDKFMKTEDFKRNPLRFRKWCEKYEARQEELRKRRGAPARKRRTICGVREFEDWVKHSEHILIEAELYRRREWEKAKEKREQRADVVWRKEYRRAEKNVRKRERREKKDARRAKRRKRSEK